MTHALQGVLAVATTPFDTEGRQDLDRLLEGVERVLAAGVDGILLLGATGEAMALTPQEQEAQVRRVVEAVQGRAPVVVGCMEYRPSHVIERIAAAKEWGAAGAMVTPSYYGGLAPEAAVAALEPVFAASELPLLLYNNPHSVGTDLLPEHMEPLLAHDSFWGVKETSGEATRVRELRERLGDQVTVFVGADGLALEGFTQGAGGWVAASAWLLPEQCVALWQAARAGEWSTAVELWNRLSGPLSAIEGSGDFISLIKQAMGRIGLEQGPVRPPLGTADSAEVDALMAAVDAL